MSTAPASDDMRSVWKLSGEIWELAGRGGFDRASVLNDGWRGLL